MSIHTAFVTADLERADSEYPYICTLDDYHKELIWAPTTWMAQGLQQTASGYGMRLNSGYKINYNGKLYRIYTTCFSNNASSWFVAKGRTIYVH